jgi:hypothetical protein
MVGAWSDTSVRLKSDDWLDYAGQARRREIWICICKDSARQRGETVCRAPRLPTTASGRIDSLSLATCWAVSSVGLPLLMLLDSFA